MNNVYRIFVSMPMHGVSDSDIRAMKVKVANELEYLKNNKPSRYAHKEVKHLHEALNTYDEFEVICTIDWPKLEDAVTRNAYEPRLKYVARALNLLADCNTAVFCPGWMMAAGCNVEFTACKLYYIPTYQFNVDHDKHDIVPLKG